jgi:glycosyltransferase involved in cell wall biosynthesis
MRLLVVHQNFPGQFRHVALEAVRRRCEVVAIGRDTAPGLEGVRLFRYRTSGTRQNGIHAYLRTYEEAVTDGQKVYQILKKLKLEDYRPDVILAHPGWGETLFIKDVYSDVPLIHFCEFYYRAHGADSGFDPEFPSVDEESSRLRVLNSMHLLNLEQCDIAIAPTQWQRSLFPAAYHSKIQVIHEGVIRKYSSPRVDSLTLPSGHVLKAGQPIVTYVARNLEPYRGFHSFMRAIPHIQAECPEAQIIIVGGDGISYGRMPIGYPNWRSRMAAEVAFDSGNVHFTGRLPYQKYRAVLELSKAHVYLTYPFVLSWSVLEAMASGCIVIASDTAPLREVIVDGVNGMLVDFFDCKAIAERVTKVLQADREFQSLSESAKLTASRFDVVNGLEGYFEMFDRLISS